MPWADERRVFAKLVNGFRSRPAVLDEFLTALGILISEYDTSIRENRFIAGGATERILATTMRTLGIDARARGLEQDDEDIMVGDLPLSVKSSFTGKRDALRLVNTLGHNRKQRWRVATVFILANRGIGYADPDLLPNAVEFSGDALILRRALLDEMHVRSPEWLFGCAVPAKGTDVSQRRAASEAVSVEILQRTHLGKSRFPNISKHV